VPWPERDPSLHSPDAALSARSVETFGDVWVRQSQASQVSH
jgi:hypothetical protein